MNAYIDTMIFIGLYFAGVVLVLFIGGLLVQTDLYRASAERRGKYYPQSRIIKDLRPIQQTMIEFVAASDPSRALLQRLAGSEQPMPLRKLLDNISARGTRWTALLVMRVARLVRFMWRGIGLTDVGREVLARTSGRTTTPRYTTRSDSITVLDASARRVYARPALQRPAEDLHRAAALELV